MRKAVDVKSLLIGVLATALFFTIIGAKSKNDANFGTITAKTVKIVNSEGKLAAFLSSGKGGGFYIYNKEGKLVADLMNHKGAGSLDIYNKEGKLVANLMNYKGAGSLDIYNKEGKPMADLMSGKGGGALNIYNKHGKMVATVQSSKDTDGAIGLYDRYGDFGWGETGKK